MKVSMDMRQGQEVLLPVEIALDTVIVSVTEDSGTTKTPSFKVSFEIVAGEHEGSRHSELYYKTEAAKFRIADLLTACSIPLLATGFDTDELVGKQLRIILAKDTYREGAQKIKKHLRMMDDSHSTTEDPLPPWAEETGDSKTGSATDDRPEFDE